MEEFELCMDESYANKTCIDEWGVAQYWNGDKGVEYNFCKDSGNDYSAIYSMSMNDEGYGETDYNNFVGYEIDFSNPQWRGKLKEAMIYAYNTLCKE